MVEINNQNFESVGKMSTTWQMLPLFFCTATLLGLCQSESIESLDVFAPATSHEAAKVNNVTLPPPGLVTEEETDFDQAPHAAPLSQRKLSRGKRFVAFPVGSSASVSQ